jgi:hypothetical protein
MTMSARTQRNNQHNETMKANKYKKKHKSQVEAAQLLINSSVAPHKTSVVPPFLSHPKP